MRLLLSDAKTVAAVSESAQGRIDQEQNSPRAEIDEVVADLARDARSQIAGWRRQIEKPCRAAFP